MPSELTMYNYTKLQNMTLYNYELSGPVMTIAV